MCVGGRAFLHHHGMSSNPIVDVFLKTQLFLYFTSPNETPLRKSDLHVRWGTYAKCTNKNIMMSSFKSSGDIQKKEGGPDSCFG